MLRGLLCDAMAEVMPVEAAPTIESLDDAVTLHIFSFLTSRFTLTVGKADLLNMACLGRCRCVSQRWSALASDDVLWQVACEAHFGLADGPRAPPGQAPLPEPSYYHAAKAWHALRESLHFFAPCPQLARMHTDAHTAWGRLKTWAEAKLPDAVPSLRGPATEADFENFLIWLDLSSNVPRSREHSPSLVDALPGLAQLRILSAIHNGQTFASDVGMAVSHTQEVLDEVVDESLAQALSQLHTLSLSAAAGPGSQSARSQSRRVQRERHLGLLGGLSAYDTCLCMRLFPLCICAAWTLYFRREGLLPNKYFVVVGGSYNLQRLMVLDLRTGDLATGPAAAMPTGRTRIALSDDARRNINMLRPVPVGTPRGGDLVALLSEHASRVHAGHYRAEALVPLEAITVGLSLFPQSGPKYSEAGTRGVRVTASVVFVAEVGMYVYSIRIKLLASSEDGGLSAEERGFETCQLKERKWILSQRNGPPEHVHGAGVVGRFPLLREGGWREDRQVDASGRIAQGEDNTGVFIYQSMSGRGPTCAFEGAITMVPGSITQPTGDEFEVAVARFPLEAGPEEFIF